jgi:hypothetical protein
LHSLNGRAIYLLLIAVQTNIGTSGIEINMILHQFECERKRYFFRKCIAWDLFVEENAVERVLSDDCGDGCAVVAERHYD